MRGESGVTDTETGKSEVGCGDCDGGLGVGDDNSDC